MKFFATISAKNSTSFVLYRIHLFDMSGVRVGNLALKCAAKNDYFGQFVAIKNRLLFPDHKSTIQFDYENFYAKKPTIINSYLREEIRRKGIGTELYLWAAVNMWERYRVCIYASLNQTQSAVALWRKLARMNCVVKNCSRFMLDHEMCEYVLSTK